MASLLEVDLLTGRTHQIRVHLGAIGFPSLGTNSMAPGKKEPIQRRALHAHGSSFPIRARERS